MRWLLFRMQLRLLVFKLVCIPERLVLHLYNWLSERRTYTWIDYLRAQRAYRDAGGKK